MEISLKYSISSLMFLIVFVYVHDQRLIILIYMFVIYNYFNDVYEYTHTCMAIQLPPMPCLLLPASSHFRKNCPSATRPKETESLETRME